MAIKRKLKDAEIELVEQLVLAGVRNKAAICQELNSITNISVDLFRAICRRQPEVRMIFERPIPARPIEAILSDDSVPVVKNGKAGRPAGVLTDDHIKLIAQMTAEGASENYIATALFGAGNRSSYDRHKKRDPRITAAVEFGKAQDELARNQDLNKQSKEGKVNATKFALQARHGYRDREAVPLIDNRQIHVAPLPLSKAEYDKLVIIENESI